MFDIAASELMVIATIGLIVLGPERLPGVLRTTGLWVRHLRRSFVDLRAEIEREAKLGDIKRDFLAVDTRDRVRQVLDDLKGVGTLDARKSQTPSQPGSPRADRAVISLASSCPPSDTSTVAGPVAPIAAATTVPPAQAAGNP
jgi:sec-independent protein translocase protein TatB